MPRNYEYLFHHKTSQKPCQICTGKLAKGFSQKYYTDCSIFCIKIIFVVDLITFDGAVIGNGTINLNDNTKGETGGEYHFNSDLGGKLNLLNGAVIRLGSKEQENGTTYGALRLVEFNPGSDTDHNRVTLDLRNNYIDRHDFGKVTQNASVNHLLDVDIDAGKADWFTATSTTAVNGQILLGGFNLLSG